MLPISLHHLGDPAHDLRKLTLEKHLAVTRILEGFQHLVALLTGWEFGEDCVAHDPLDHVDLGFFGLATALDQHEEELTETHELIMVKGKF